MNSQLLKRNNFTELIATVAVKYANINCKTCKHLQRYTHPIQEKHYNNVAVIGECKKMSLLIYNNDKPRCKGILYEEKEYDDDYDFRTGS